MTAASSREVRDHIVDALRADLLGPFAGDADPMAEELWDMAPSKRYLTGFLVPAEQAQFEEPDKEDDPNDLEQLGAGDDPNEESNNDPQVKRRPLFPSSMGLSVLLPPGQGDSVAVRVSYADYFPDWEEAESHEDGKKAKPELRWRRIAKEPIEFDLSLSADLAKDGGQPLGDTGLFLFGHLDKPDSVDGLEHGARALSLFVVNNRPPEQEKRLRDSRYVFQACLEVRHEKGVLARPDLAAQAAVDPDDRILDLQFRDVKTYASGHGVSVVPIEEDGRVVGARTEWLPQAIVKRVTTHEIDGVETSMEALAELADADEVRKALSALPEAYEAWLKKEDDKAAKLDSRRIDVANVVLQRARRARARIEEGIELLATNVEARQAFATANRAMAMAARQRSPHLYEEDVPKWRLFQLAFVLLNLPTIVDETHDDRDTVELIFFPTGGGKTEAYLGVIAFTLLWRRRVGAERPDKGLGVAVLLRYTLRLLTLDQLGRAATLICALEMLRKTQPELGDVRFSLGLWVGKSATANRLSEVARQISEYRNGSSNLSPFPLAACPWCKAPITSKCMSVVPNQKNATAVEVGCGDYDCDFSNSKGGLPVVFVDEQIYRECPSFIVATVDKFAMMPWRGESGALFGQVTGRAGHTFVGPVTPLPPTVKEKAVPLPAGLRPPDLIVQDELHLISGPLGTMVGLYETAVELLATRVDESGTTIKPKILASTATVKRAVQQIQALYGRDDMAMFPPQGLDDSESFFAKVDKEANGRLYLGIAAAGRSTKAILVTVYGALLAAAYKRLDPKGEPGQAADPYTTLVGYFNNLRELGGMRRLVEDLVYARTANRGELMPLDATDNPWMANRVLERQPIELTSRESTSAISKAKEWLGSRYGEDDFRPLVLASNMISVGVDIDRLGLMVVAGQPKSTSEYIQASSRVGRDDSRPGLVVTCYNLNKPRDRSYYEHFKDYHESFYRRVEATSVTPFSGPALERGLLGCLMAIVRHGDPKMGPAKAAMSLGDAHAVAQRAVDALAARAEAQPGDDGELAVGVKQLAQDFLDEWSKLILEATDGGAQRTYSPYDLEKSGNPLLQTALDKLRLEQQGQAQGNHFVAPTSMRDVEPTVHLWLKSAGWGAGR